MKATASATLHSHNVTSSQRMRASGGLGLGGNSSSCAAVSLPVAHCLRGRLHIIKLDVFFTDRAINASTSSASSSASSRDNCEASASEEPLLPDQLHLDMQDAIFVGNAILYPPPSISARSSSSGGGSGADFSSKRSKISCNLTLGEVEVREQLCDDSVKSELAAWRQAFGLDDAPSRGSTSSVSQGDNLATGGHAATGTPTGSADHEIHDRGVTQSGSQRLETAYASFQQSLHQHRVLLSFHSGRKSQILYNAPHVDVNIEYYPATGGLDSLLLTESKMDTCSRISANVLLEPFVASAEIALISKWVGTFSELPLPGVSQTDSSSYINCTVRVAQAELLLLAAPTVTTQEWGDLVLDALQLDQHPEQWQPISTQAPQNRFYPHLIDSKAGLKFNFEDVSLSIRSNVAQSQSSVSKTKEAAANSAPSGGSSGGGNSFTQALHMGYASLSIYISAPFAHDDDDAAAETEAEAEAHITTVLEDGVLSSIRHEVTGMRGKRGMRGLVYSSRRRRAFREAVIVEASSDETRTRTVSLSRGKPVDVEQESNGDHSSSYSSAPASAPAPGSRAENGGKSSSDVGPIAPPIDPGAYIHVAAHRITAGTILDQ